MTRFVGATPVPIPIRQENDFRLDPDELRASSPADEADHPQLAGQSDGGVLTREDLTASPTWPRERDIAVLTDEIYGRDRVRRASTSRITTLPGMAERTIILDGFSKTYAMTGWRMGYAIVPPSSSSPIQALIINSVSGTSTFSQVAAAEALNGPQDAVDEMVEEFRARRDLIVDGLNAIDGVECLPPKGAFYVFPDISGTGLTGRRVRRPAAERGGRVRARAGPRSARSARNHLRISYANSRENIARRSTGCGPCSSRRCRAACDRHSRRLSDARPVADRPRVFVAPPHPRRGPRPASARRPTPTSGPTSCRRPATSCCGASRASTACWRC